MKWILWVIAVTANGNAVTVDKTLFPDEMQCKTAASQVVGTNSTAIGSNARVEAVCLARGD